jgi:gamma-glutamylcyclotransferase (GGCT)/AIG2-like uncharacterized protein YtfP
VYTLKNEEEFSWAFEQLDDYEGLHVLPNEQPLYKREIITITQNGVEDKAWVYWYNGNIENLPRIATEDLFEYLTTKNKS